MEKWWSDGKDPIQHPISHPTSLSSPPSPMASTPRGGTHHGGWSSAASIGQNSVAGKGGSSRVVAWGGSDSVGSAGASGKGADKAPGRAGSADRGVFLDSNNSSTSAPYRHHRRPSVWASCCCGGGAVAAEGERARGKPATRAAKASTGQPRRSRMRSMNGVNASVSVVDQVAAMVQRFEDRHLGSAQLRFDAETVAAEDPSQLQDLSNIGRAVAERYLGKDAKQKKIRQQAERWMEEHAEMIARGV